ncbi:GNAT family N-acetyltransferase [Microbacterium sp. P06]|uniref:GNAT family N-acetyltransferase n=1 Tax=Microbacterium sp. P06 TaxID=3366949 RepID=UPI0037471BCF
MSSIRPFRPGDEAALAEICVRTAWAGADGTGRYRDDAIWPAIFVLPYVARHPAFAFVVENGDGLVGGYIVGVPDTRAFEEWFHDEWWPTQGARWPSPAPDDTSPEAGTLRYAAGRRAGAEPYGDDYPAHLHIDLLPEMQGAGWGRRLVDTLLGALRDAGVTGVHLAAGVENTGALAFYPRVGFEPLPSTEGVQAFGRML